MEKRRFDRLAASLDDVRTHVTTGRFAGRISKVAIVRGSGNVFADLGYPDAAERQTKLRLAYAINSVVDESRLTAVPAAEQLNIHQKQVSLLRNYKLDGFPVERLMNFLTALDHDVEIVIRKKPRSRAAARIRVVVA
jgi:predicted XRE-type DNA-binding protein